LKVSAISPQQGREASRFKNSFRRKCISISRKFSKSDLNVTSRNSRDENVTVFRFTNFARQAKCALYSFLTGSLEPSNARLSEENSIKRSKICFGRCGGRYNDFSILDLYVKKEVSTLYCSYLLTACTSY